MQYQKSSPEDLCVIMKKHSPTEPIFIDPVCLKTVTDGKRDSTVTYRFRTYYFCTPSCCKAFEKNPDKYLEPKIRRQKGLRTGYFGRLRQVARHWIF